MLAASGDLAGCTRELQQVPKWWPQKSEALFREGQAHLQMDRARDAEAAWLAAVGDDLLHPAGPAVFHDASQELLSLYATENRWDDARIILWKIYDRATPAYRPTVLAMRLQCELERIAPAESIKLLLRYVAADPADWEACRAMANAELALGQHSEALRDMRDCLNARPGDPRVWRDYLTILQSLGEMDAFNAALAAVPATAESQPEIWMFRGEARERGRLGHRGRALSTSPPDQAKPAERALPPGHYRSSPGPHHPGDRAPQTLAGAAHGTQRAARPSSPISMPSSASPMTAPSYWRPSNDWPRSAGPSAGLAPRRAGGGSPFTKLYEGAGVFVLPALRWESTAPRGHPFAGPRPRYRGTREGCAQPRRHHDLCGAARNSRRGFVATVPARFAVEVAALLGQPRSLPDTHPNILAIHGDYSPTEFPARNSHFLSIFKGRIHYQRFSQQDPRGRSPPAMSSNSCS